MDEISIRFTFAVPTNTDIDGDGGSGDEHVLDQLIAWFEARGLDCTVGVSIAGHGYGTVPTALLEDFRKIEFLASVTPVPESER